MTKEKLIRQINSEDWIKKIIQEEIPPEKWNIEPDIVYELYKKKVTDKTTSLYVLKTLFHNYLPYYYKLGKMKKIINYIVDLSPKDKILKRFLESIFISEYWNPLRLHALEKISEHFPKLAFSLFNIVQYEDLDRFLEYVFNEYKKNFNFLKALINDELILFYLKLKRNTDYFVKLMLSYNRYIKLGYDSNNRIQYFKFKPYKRSKIIRKFNASTIFNNFIAYFVYNGFVADKKQTSIYLFDHLKRNKQIILFMKKESPFLKCYSINKSFLKSLIKTIKQHYNLKDEEIIFKIEKTSILYLILNLETRGNYFSLKYKLTTYHLLLEDLDHHNIPKGDFHQIKKVRKL